VLDWGGWSTPRPGHFTPRGRPGTHCTEGWEGPPPGPVWTSAENLAATGIRSPDRPARTQSTHRLRYPDPRQFSMKPNITNIKLANHRCRIPTNIITAVMRIKNLPNQISGHLDVPKNVLGIPGLFKKRYSPGEKTGRIGALLFWEMTQCTLMGVYLPLQTTKFLSNYTGPCHVTRSYSRSMP
jgi:hypothetical protein